MPQMFIGIGIGLGIGNSKAVIPNMPVYTANPTITSRACKGRK